MVILFSFLREKDCVRVNPKFYILMQNIRTVWSALKPNGLYYAKILFTLSTDSTTIYVIPPFQSSSIRVNLNQLGHISKFSHFDTFCWILINFTKHYVYQRQCPIESTSLPHIFRDLPASRIKKWKNEQEEVWPFKTLIFLGWDS
jgi:hypothetical protein